VGARTVAGGAVVVLAVALGISQLPSVGTRDAARPGDVVLSTKDMKFSATSLTAHGTRVAVVVKNHDLFWHTFTIKGDLPGTYVDLAVPVGGTRRASFTVPAAGKYTFYCAIPGHRQAGMHGTLTIT
jgi:uncharacterized cupredoxin-like copper-binding protein